MDHDEASFCVQKAFRDKGIPMIHAKVSGSIDDAQNGTLTFMVRGDQPSLERAQETLKLMGEIIVCANSLFPSVVFPQ